MKADFALLFLIFCGLMISVCHCAARADQADTDEEERRNATNAIQQVIALFNSRMADRLKPAVRIVNGYETKIEKYPYQVINNVSADSRVNQCFTQNGIHHCPDFIDQVALEKTPSDFQCGGSIISPDWILTAAHCLTSRKPDLQVRSGSTALEKGGSLHKIVSILKHPNYNDKTQDWDIALLKIDPPIDESESSRPVKLVDFGGYSRTGEKVTVSGWGVLTEASMNPSKKLMTASVTVVNHRLCRLMYALTTVITKRMMCAGSTRGQDACQGDSGGPLVNSAGVQIGIVSFGKGCAHWVYPGIYTNLADPKVRAFIRENTGI